MTRWYRAYEGTVTDAKLAEVAMVAGCSRSVVIATWHACLENAANVNDGGRIDIPSRRIAAVLCEPFDTIEGVMLGFETVGLLLDSVITSWPKMCGRERPPANEWAEIRLRIFERDHFTCSYCGATGCRLECDHIVPVARGGGHEDCNLTTACFNCNRSKRDKLIGEWRP